MRALLLLLLLAPPGEACSVAGPEPHTTAPDPTDLAPPEPVPSLAIEVHRATADGGCGGGTSSCADLGQIILHLDQPSDDRSSAEQLGYALSVTSGSLPSGLSLPSSAVQASAGRISLVWSDEGEAFDFEIGVTTVDGTGKTSAQATAPVSNEGAAESCRQSPLGSPVGLLTLLALFGTRRLFRRG